MIARKLMASPSYCYACVYARMHWCSHMCACGGRRSPSSLFLRSHLPCFFWHRVFHFLELADAARLARSDPQVSAWLHLSSHELSSSDDMNSGDSNSHLHAGIVSSLSSQLSLSPIEVSKSLLKVYLCNQQFSGVCAHMYKCLQNPEGSIQPSEDGSYRQLWATQQRYW